MSDAFTPRTRKILALAQDIARRSGASELGDLPILIAIVEENGGIAARVLRKLGLSLPPLYQDLPAPAVASALQPAAVDLPLSADVRRLMDIASDLARGVEADSIGTEHLLLVMTRTPQTPAGQALARAGITESAVRTAAALLV
jgi:ATP-dependent Clp protease ATP-binding subunit ClpC